MSKSLFPRILFVKAIEVDLDEFSFQGERAAENLLGSFEDVEFGEYELKAVGTVTPTFAVKSRPI